MNKVPNDRPDRFAEAMTRAMEPRTDRRHFDWHTVLSCVLIFVCGYVAGIGTVWM